MTRLNYYFPDYVTIEPGKFGEEDYVLKINDQALMYRTLASFCAFFARLEEIRFPQREGFLGKWKLIDCLLDAMDKGHVPREILERHQI